MKMQSNYLLVFILPVLLLSSCDRDENMEPKDRGEKIILNFDLPQIKPEQAHASRVAASTSLLADGTLFSIRAYKRNKAEGGTPASTIFVDNGIYKVSNSGTKAIPRSDNEALKLTRGTYDLYFLSYHSTANTPDITGETTSVTNGNDFLGASLKQTIIQADKDGQTELTIPMTGHPFSHLCSRVKATLEIPKEQIVAPQKITELKISVKNLRSAGTYSWLSEQFTVKGARSEADSLLLIASGTLNDIQASTNVFPVSLGTDDTFVLPLDENEALRFGVYMTVAYTDKGSAKIKKLAQTVKLKKALLPAMSYNFVFSLTFYGEYLPADLTLDVQDYTPVELNPGDVGGDE